MKSITANTLVISLFAAALAAVSLTSCGTNDPEYKAWKEQQNASANNPYGVPPAGGESGSYTPSGSAPYQPLPGVNPPPTPQPPLASDTAPGVPSAPVGSTISHTVAAGDSLWALAKKYGTSVESIQAANGLSNSNIRIGQSLQIPGQ